jgi:predicted transposase YdaD
MTERIEREAGATEAKDLLASASILMGLTFPAAFVQALLKGVRQMKESTVYQEIFAEGRRAASWRGRSEASAKQYER